MAVVKGFPSGGNKAICNAGDVGSIPGSGRSQGGGNGNPFWYFCLKNSMDRGAWWATVYGVTKSRTRLSMHTGTWPLLKFLNAKRREISVGEKPEMLYRES